MKLNKMEHQLSFIQKEFGQIDKIVELSDGKFLFYLIIISPIKERPYNIVCTLGVSQIKPQVAPKDVKGFEFFMVLPEEWEYPQNEDDIYNDGWVQIVIEEIVEILLHDEIIVPGSTIGFKHLKNGSKHNAILVSLSNKYNAIYEEKNKSIIYFELQSLLPDELNRVIAKDKDLINKIMDLPFVDMQRSSLI